MKVLTGERDKLNKMYEEVRLILYVVFNKKVYIVMIHYRNYPSLICQRKVLFIVNMLENIQFLACVL